MFKVVIHLPALAARLSFKKQSLFFLFAGEFLGFAGFWEWEFLIITLVAQSDSCGDGSVIIYLEEYDIASFFQSVL